MLDFYSKFEGEPEIRFVLRGLGGREAAGVRVWEGYFDSIVAEIQPEDGQWTGLALPYHLHEGWYAGKPWKVSNLGVVTSQWERIPVHHLAPEYQEVHSAVLELMRSAAAYDGEIWITQE